MQPASFQTALQSDIRPRSTMDLVTCIVTVQPVPGRLLSLSDSNESNQSDRDGGDLTRPMQATTATHPAYCSGSTDPNGTAGEINVPIRVVV